MSEYSSDQVQISLPRDAALVLFEMLAARSDDSHLLIRDSAEQVALWKLEGVLESTLVEPLKPDYLTLLSAAKERLAK